MSLEACSFLRGVQRVDLRERSRGEDWGRGGEEREETAVRM